MCVCVSLCVCVSVRVLAEMLEFRGFLRMVALLFIVLCLVRVVAGLRAFAPNLSGLGLRVEGLGLGFRV